MVMGLMEFALQSVSVVKNEESRHNAANISSLDWVFSLIDKVDEFIFLDNVQFDKRSWQQSKIKTKTGAS